VRELGGSARVALSPRDDLPTCAQALVDHDLDAIPVIDEDKRVLGLVTAHSLVRAAADVPPPWHPTWRGDGA
jgi:CBS-domain-containing membrane protein